MPRRAILLSLVLLLAQVAAQAAGGEQDWPQWRGPTHDGHAGNAEIVETAPADGWPILWLRDLGSGYSGFAVAEGRAYTLTQTLYEQSLVCLTVKTGETLWSVRIGWPYEGGGLYPGPRATPTIVGDLVYYATPQGDVGCVNATSRQIVWSLNVNEKFEGKGTEFGYSASPLVIDGLVILPVGGAKASVVALDAQTGETRWKSGTQPASYSTPLPITWQDEPLVVVLLQNSFACFHRTTGELWWELPLSHGYDEHSSSPLYREPFLMVSGPFRAGAQFFRLIPEEGTGRCMPERLWESPQLSNDVASSVLVEETVYGFDLREAQSRLHRPSRGEFRALDWQTGEVLWSSAEPGHAQIISADGKLVLFNDRGEVIVAAADRDGYRELGRLTLFADEVCWTMPALADNHLLLRTQTRAACVYLGRKPLAAEQAFITESEIPQRARFDPTWLVGGERDYPATLPEDVELWRWFGWSLAGLGAAMLLALLFRGGERLFLTIDAGHESSKSLIVFWSAVFIAGAGGSFAVNRLQDDYVFTWPLALWAGLHIALAFTWSARVTRFWSRERATSYLAGGLFFALCGLYFHLCRWLGLALEWGFLLGFTPAIPPALLATWLATKRSAWASVGMGLMCVISFSVYYWSSVMFLVWWTRSMAQ
jgi:outer membrane protein assembly factor BamB